MEEYGFNQEDWREGKQGWSRIAWELTRGDSGERVISGGKFPLVFQVGILLQPARIWAHNPQG